MMHILRKAIRLTSAVLLMAALMLLFLCSCSERTTCRDIRRFPEVFQEHPYLRTGYIVFPKTIPASGLANGAEFYDYSSDDFLDPTAEIVLRCRYDDTDFANEIKRLENTVKTSPTGEKPILIDDGSRFSVPAYIAEYNEDCAYEYAAVTGPREITYVYLAFRYPDQVAQVPATALPTGYEQFYTRNGPRISEPKDSYDIYEFLSPDKDGKMIRCISYTDDDWPAN